MPLPFEFDFKNPDYLRVFNWRVTRLNRIRANPDILVVMRNYYRSNPVQFVIDWGCTYDPRHVRRGLPATMPFLLFPKQEALGNWVVDHWKTGQDGVIEKSRDMGISWLTIAIATSLCLFNDGMAIGCGSRKGDLVDVLGAPDSLLEKVRLFIEILPIEFRGGWERSKHGGYMKILFPETGSSITGEAGDAIGRGGRKAMYIVDEAAHLERPQLIEASLSATTDCRIDLSSVNGMQNPFAVKTHSWPTEHVFRFHWRDDPRKDDEWYKNKILKTDPITMAQEYDIDYAASVGGILIPTAWAQSCIDAHIKLGIKPTGERYGALDVADEGIDLNAFAARHGILLTYLESWSGKGGNLFKTTERAFDLCDTNGCRRFLFDSDGLGVGVRGDADVINGRDNRKHAKRDAVPYRGSEKPVNLEQEFIKGDEFIEGRTNEDYFKNRKAQAWFAFRRRVEMTHWAVTEGRAFDPDEIVSLPSSLPELGELLAELSQVTYDKDTAGKMLIDKAPNGAKSPNLADAVVMVFAPEQVQGGGFFG